MVDRERLLQFFLDLVRIPSPSFAEGAVFDCLEERFRALDLAVTRHPYRTVDHAAQNLLAVLEKNAEGYEPLILSAHADTVRPCDAVQPQVDGDIVRSDGTTVLGGDDKCALAEILELLSVLKEDGLPHGRLEIVVSSAEELGLVGARHLPYDRFQAVRALVLDASGSIGTAVTAAPAHVTWRITCRGRKAHAGIEPEKGISAIRIAAALIAAFPTGRLDRDSVANFGTIQGGEATNIVPDETVLTLELRSHSPLRLSRYEDRLKKAIRRTEARCGGTVEIVETGRNQAYRARPDEPLLEDFRQACQACGVDYLTQQAGGCSDANILSEHGLGCLNLACGMNAVHTNGEFVRISDMEKMSVLLVDLVTRRLRREPRSAT
jgi:tripeptide aminopeptidase